MKIEHIESIFGTDLFRQALIANTELILAGQSEGTFFPFSDESEATFIREDDKSITALIIWKSCNEKTEAWISLAWVAKEKRRQGYYRKLFEAVCAECRVRKYREIESFVYEDNAAMKATAIALGQKPIRTVYGTRFTYEPAAESPVIP